MYQKKTTGEVYKEWKKKEEKQLFYQYAIGQRIAFR